MSLSSAISNAASGLAASARAVQITSSNVANALTEGYASRRLDLASSSLNGVGTGVRIAGITRQNDPVLAGLLRDAAGNAAHDTTRSAFWEKAEAAIGLPGAGISKALSKFENALISASSRPDLEPRLSSVEHAASGLTKSFAAAQDQIQTLRANADRAIASDVKALNSGLAKIDKLNEHIIRLTTAGHQTEGLQDERDTLVAKLSEIVPLNQISRSDGRVSLFTTSGQLLLDLTPVEFSFDAAPTVDATMTVGNGLSHLMLGNRPLNTSETGPFAGGRLAANFAIRDTDGVVAQNDLDTLANTLVGRFADPSTDPTLAHGQPGLFTDANGPLSASPPPGLAGRLSVHEDVRPSKGGDLSRIRDGLGASSSGPIGNPIQLNRLLDALNRPVALTAGAPKRRFSANVGTTLTQFSTSRQDAEEIATTATARHAELKQQSLANGVDTDAEMRRLISIEQSYAANARLIQTADAMLRRLMEI